eukprot:TRINITY_DN1044_c0_g1_i4.p1 TRINITY_DN1044_c0_g1~~TRINITY_DN1044_c0_g1_i4.p1  ORF type:complete len:197 (+),score=58.80 TRINITY_DN1044_c0_g1_i4:231-821(+)
MRGKEGPTVRVASAVFAILNQKSILDEEESKEIIDEENINNIYDPLRNQDISVVGVKPGVLTDKKQLLVEEEASKVQQKAINKVKAETKVTKIYKEGWLKKLGGVRKNWKKRWFLLDDKKLAYFAKKGDANPINTIFLHSSCEVTLSEDKQFCIELITDTRVWKFVAVDNDEMHDWFYAIREGIWSKTRIRSQTYS